MTGVPPFPVQVTQLRVDHPEVSDETRFSGASLKLYLDIANSVIDPQRWGAYAVLGAELYALHNLALDKLNTDAASRGGVPGTNLGVVSSKSLGGASMSFDGGSSGDPAAGEFNLTTYGRRLWRLILMVGAGPVQLGGQPPPWPTTEWGRFA